MVEKNTENASKVSAKIFYAVKKQESLEDGAGTTEVPELLSDTSLSAAPFSATIDGIRWLVHPSNPIIAIQDP